MSNLIKLIVYSFFCFILFSSFRLFNLIDLANTSKDIVAAIIVSFIVLYLVDY